MLPDRYNILKEEGVHIHNREKYRGHLINLPVKFANLLNLEQGDKVIIYPEVRGGCFTGRLILRPEEVEPRPIRFAFYDMLANWVKFRLLKKSVSKLIKKKDIKEVNDATVEILAHTVGKSEAEGGLSLERKRREVRLYLRLLDEEEKKSKKTPFKKRLAGEELAFSKYGKAVYMSNLPFDDEGKHPKDIKKEIDKEYRSYKKEASEIVKQIMGRPKRGRKPQLEPSDVFDWIPDEAMKKAKVKKPLKIKKISLMDIAYEIIKKSKEKGKKKKG